MYREADSVECGSCRQPFAVDAIPGSCPKCGSTSRAYVIGQTKHYVLRAEPLQSALRSAASAGTQASKTVPPAPSVDDVLVPYEVAPGADERTRLLARINALINAILGIASGVADFDKHLFIGKLADLQAAIGIAKGTKKDLADGRVTDEA